jgi:hypothetical protein
VLFVLFFRTSASFQLHFTIFHVLLVALSFHALLAALSALALPTIEDWFELFYATGGVIVSLVLISYVWRSRRINVTFRRRLRAGDPLLPA